MKIIDKYGDSFDIEPEKLSGIEIGKVIKKTINRFKMEHVPHLMLVENGELFTDGKGNIIDPKRITVFESPTMTATPERKDTVIMKSVQCGKSSLFSNKIQYRNYLIRNMISDINKKRTPDYVLDSLKELKS